MSDWKRRLEEEFDDLERLRDELRVQVDLGKKELKTVWKELELDHKWQGLEQKMERMAREARDASDDVASAAQLLLGEIREGFSRIRRAL